MSEVNETKKELESSVLGQNRSDTSIHDGTISNDDAEREKYEVFKKTDGGVDFRTVTWQRATLIFMKIQISTGILGIPGALYSLGAIGGGLSIVGWQVLNTCAWLLIW